ncbi:hypothetical protein TSTA_126800 [Talaromyces stipitatus ATCC 10500]|uniref:DNA 3'-5' helicase n=1 Tax=Talaromyces stipitatus (strain ATCC 10500 / CBS 375.48 / QM 6759 / NRRL 1006) TaxID=441959 RepID=B8MCS0_TALSN|nr:uncharacterized protein TSTA_126800 [Talaromyces stipitatus ATCC 10500]EED18972.1 hypothetical protein TSTA_126800 [Talaromyces stipitatus ATCC 10500]
MRKLDTESEIRVILATEALGVGVNLPDIRRSVLYGLPKNLLLATFLQRGGQTCRDGGKGEIILLVDAWTVGERIISSTIQQVSIVDKIPPKKKSSDKERRSKLPQLWYDTANQIQCIQRGFLRFFEEPEGYWIVKKDQCCNHCNPTLRIDDIDSTKYYVYHERGPQFGKIQKAVHKDLQAWATEQVHTLSKDFAFTPTAGCLLRNDMCILLARNAYLIFTSSALKTILRP